MGLFIEPESPTLEQATSDATLNCATSFRNQLQDTFNTGRGEGDLGRTQQPVHPTHPDRRSTVPMPLRRTGTPRRSASGSVWTMPMDHSQYGVYPAMSYLMVPAKNHFGMAQGKWGVPAGDITQSTLQEAVNSETGPNVAIQKGAGQRADDGSGCIDPALLVQDGAGSASLKQANCSSSYGKWALPHVGAPPSPVAIECASANPVSYITRSRHVSSVGGVRPKPSRGTCHFGKNCEETLHDCSRRGVKEHFLRFHEQELRYYTYEGKEVVNCPWYEEGKLCGQRLARDSLCKHVATSHLHSTRIPCPYCPSVVSRIDALWRHLRRDCKLIPDDAKHEVEERYKDNQRRRELGAKLKSEH